MRGQEAIEMWEQQRQRGFEEGYKQALEERFEKEMDAATPPASRRVAMVPICPYRIRPRDGEAIAG